MTQPVVLIVGAHHEEVEAEFPNLAAALALAGCRVVILNPIGGWNWTAIRSLEGDGRARTIADATAAAAALGCEKVIWDYPVALVPEHQGELKHRLAAFFCDLQPDILLMHWPKDGHPDHRAVANLTRHVASAASSLIDDRIATLDIKEIYAFQTGVGQAYDFVPDMLVKVDEETMRRAHAALDCFRNTVPQFAEMWRANVVAKANYWKMLIGDTPAEALKFIGPRLPLDGFLLKKILGDRLVSTAFERYWQWTF